MIVRTRQRRCAGRLLCWLLALVMATSPSVWAVAQQPRAATESEKGEWAIRPATDTGQLDLTYCTNRAFAAVSVYPRRLLTAKMLELLPIEVATAAGIEYLGFDPVDIESAQAFIEPPTAGGVTYAVVLKFAKPFRGNQLKPKIREHTIPAELGGKRYLKSQNPILPSFYMPDDRTLVAASDVLLKRVVSGKNDGATSPLIEHLKTVQAGSDAYAAVSLESVQPMIALGIGVARESGDVPPELAPFLDAPSMIRTVDLSVNIVTDRPSQLVVHANDKVDAEKLQQLLDDSLAMYREKALEQAKELQQSDDPVEAAFGKYIERTSGQFAEICQPTRDGKKFYLFKTEPGGKQQQQLYTVAIIGVLVALLLPAVQAAREAARRAQCQNNFKQLMLGLLNYESSRGQLPAQANYDKDGKPLLSWRVHILPYLEEQTLYDQFHLDEPWGSPHNKKLVAQMPEVYRCPSSPLADSGKTTYLSANGKGLFMDGKEGIRFASIRDGTSNTIALVEVADEHAVIWTKPEDLEFNPKKPMAKLGSAHPGIFMAAFCDGHIDMIAEDIDAETLKAFFTRSGGEAINDFRE